MIRDVCPDKNLLAALRAVWPHRPLSRLLPCSPDIGRVCRRWALVQRYRAAWCSTLGYHSIVWHAEGDPLAQGLDKGPQKVSSACYPKMTKFGRKCPTQRV